MDMYHPVTSMLDLALSNLEWGQEYLHAHPVVDHDSIMQFLGDTANAIHYFRRMAAHGSETTQFLSKVQYEMSSVMAELE
jgi:hypothetical protein|mmetsp:Transcript_33738/g.44493  ORF Transcript_33738/g.44493 Transcript_33738/m.44493 type:complete len:80 (+) Transcript_33738:155-394(+)